MSQHSVCTHFGAREVVVVAGYDRPLNDLFLQVLGQADSCSPDAEDVLYSSLEEPQHDWTDINTVAAKLTELGIDVPPSMLECVYLDQLTHAGNRVVRHHADRSPDVLLAS